jgi:hypothetical protein
MNKLHRYLPWIIGLFCVMVFGRSLVEKPYAKQTFDLNTFSQIPVLYNGRNQPMDSFARNNMKIITDKQFYIDPQGQKQPAIRWVLEVMSGAPDVRKHQVFRIEHEDVLTLMGLQQRKSLRYSLDELVPRYSELIQQVNTILQKPEVQRDLVDAKMLELYNQLEIYRQIMNFEAPLVLPPADKQSDLWLPLGAEKRNLDLTRAANVWYKSLRAYSTNDVTLFNTVVAEHLATLKKEQPQLFPRIQIEQRFNLTEPFYQSMVLFVVAFLLSVFGWMFWAQPLGRSAFVVTLLGLIIFTVALGVRMYLQGRPPVTNLYSSAIFVGWVAVIMGLGIEWYLKNGFGTIMAAMTGFCALLVAHNLDFDHKVLGSEYLRAGRKLHQ